MPHSALCAYIDPTGGLPPPSLWGVMLASAAAGVGMLLAMLGVFRRRLGYTLLRRGKAATAIALVLCVLAAGGFLLMKLFPSRRAAPTSVPPAARRVLVLGFDGLDPLLLNSYMAEGRMPNFSRLAKDGLYHTLRTTNPPQSPVAWASFITGDSPLQHGIFDFLKRDPKTYLPDLTIADRKTMRLPWKGTPFWESQRAVSEQGLVSLRLPVTFPPPTLNGALLSGMGVWDARGTEGTYFYYSVHPPAGDLRGMILPLRPRDQVYDGDIPGPYRAGQPDTLREPFELQPSADGSTATLRVQGQALALADGRWSDWLRLKFTLGTFQSQSVSVVTRVIYRRQNGEPTLYVSPLNFDPKAPLYAISQPKSYAAELTDELGCFHTRGMPYDTQALNDGVLSDDAFLDQWRTIMSEDENLLSRELSRFHSGMLMSYFEGTDIIQHMFWRAIDPEHPLYDSPETAPYRRVIPDAYERCDAVLGRARAALGNDAAVVVISDHGFAPFRRAVHLNSILRQLGYLSLQQGRTSSGEFFEGVDWSRTRAYAIGFNAVYLNLAGREGKGSVPSREAATLVKTLAEQLEQWKDPETGASPIKKAYVTAAPSGATSAMTPDLLVGYVRGYRASWETALGAAPEKLVEPNNRKWSGDHCIDPDEVPGIFLSSDRSLDAAALTDVAAAVGKHLEGGPK